MKERKGKDKRRREEPGKEIDRTREGARSRERRIEEIY
jgi:hypothetical protein